MERVYFVLHRRRPCRGGFAEGLFRRVTVGSKIACPGHTAPG
jgi:hypothetical protein